MIRILSFFKLIKYCHTFIDCTDHGHVVGDLLLAAHVALLDHGVVLLHPTLVLLLELLLEDGVRVVDVLELLVVGPQLAGLQDDDEEGEPRQHRDGEDHPLLGATLDHLAVGSAVGVVRN